MDSVTWSAATESQQASFVGRQIGRSAGGGGGTVSQIGYFNAAGERIVRTWNRQGDMIETNLGKTDAR